MTNICKRVYKEIKKYSTIVIARHIGPDPDALGSQFALKELIQNRFSSKKVYAVGAHSSRFRFMGSLDKLEEFDKKNTLLIVVDTPDIKRIDGVDIEEFKHILKIDHHPIVDDYASINYVDDTASSTGQLILEFIFANRLRLTESIARNIYMAVVSDTGRFMHGYTTKRTFELITKMLEKIDIDFTKLYQPLYMRPLSEIRFQGYIFENIEVTEHGVGYIKITDDKLKDFGVDSASAGNIISELKFIDEVYVWVFFTEDIKSDVIRVNIRSRGPAINGVASQYGGGGHKYASGARLSSWNDADGLIVDLDELLEEYLNDKKTR